ncbi:MAG: 50S ribosomal protein L20 [Planctomycetota bacterium]
MRTRIGSARRKKLKRWFNEAKGNRGGRSKLLRTVKETVIRSRAYAYRDRKNRKRAFRRLWIVRINAAVRPHGLMYSTFMHGLKLAEVELDRKSLSELAINEPAVFEEIVAVAKDALAAKTAA